MAVLQVREDTKDRGGGGDSRYIRRYTRAFTVTVSSSRDGPEVVLAATGIPRVWAPYVPASGKADLRSWCKDVDAKPTDSPYVWRVTAKYDGERDVPPSRQNEQPHLRPPEVSFSVNRVAVPWLYDRKGYAITNSAGEVFDPPPEEDEKRLQIRIARNQKDLDYLYYMTFVDTVNADVWFSFKRGMVKCSDIKADLQFEQGAEYWRVVFIFEVKWPRVPCNAQWGNQGDQIGRRTVPSWTRWFLDRGFRERDVRTGNLKPIKSPTNLGFVSQPALLNGRGRAILRPNNTRAVADPVIDVPFVPGTGSGEETPEYDTSAIVLQEKLTGSGTGTAEKVNRCNGPNDPVFLGYNQFPAKRFARLAIF